MVVISSVNLKGFVKSPTSALSCISQIIQRTHVGLMIAKFGRLEFDLFAKPPEFEFIGNHLIEFESMALENLHRNDFL